MSKICTSQKFRKEYTERFPVIRSSKRGENYAFCTCCSSDISISHGGINDIRKHINAKKHQANSEAAKGSTISDFLASTSSSNVSVIRAETLFTDFIIEHSLPISVADHATKLFKNVSRLEHSEKVFMWKNQNFLYNRNTWQPCNGQYFGHHSCIAFQYGNGWKYGLWGCKNCTQFVWGTSIQQMASSNRSSSPCRNVINLQQGRTYIQTLGIWTWQTWSPVLVVPYIRHIFEILNW